MHTEQHQADGDEVASSAFDRRPETVANARSWAAKVYRGYGGPLPDLCELLVSELATNAVVHGRGEEYRVTVYPDFCIEVWDASPVRPKRRHAETDATGGRGLELLEACAPGYTVFADEVLGGKTVCFAPKEW
jgi:anti-sigma regulatory factor (Ser/Thr protein kinase)